MRQRTMNSLAVTICVLVVSAATFASEQGRFEKTLNVSGAADLEVLTHSGNVTVHNGATGSIKIVGRIHVGDRWFSGNRKADVEAIENNPRSSRMVIASVSATWITATFRSTTRSQPHPIPRCERRQAPGTRPSKA